MGTMVPTTQPLSISAFPSATFQEPRLSTQSPPAPTQWPLGSSSLLFILFYGSNSIRLAAFPRPMPKNYD